MRKQVKSFAEEDGFTLLETLITVAIVSLLSMVIVGALGQVRTMSAVSNRTDQEVRYGAILNYLDATLANARPLRLLGRQEADPVVMDGDVDRLNFVAIVKTGTSIQSLREVIWTSSSDGKQRQFAQLSKPRRLQPELQLGEQNVLANGNLSVTFRYLNDDRRQADDQLWLRKWKSDRLPAAVEIKIQADDGSRLITMTRIVPLDSGSVPSR
ncbi:prepilin-type N-terminal cleavage/methylation domain-containing protein [Rhizobium sp. SG741]|uniref:prepilin-type N-terminal cleavage/methylation domain-containing protein n=1 Tax=Rhizobium sp. SG741 TaxID=2587114 RepID=UPI0014466A8F|nr:prepilin-type N-terminal cleavage/methylation domain-containing protein [Rhizobium sp. SG741]NKJ09006.1 prepilin-type N-terminal cleavage/methylation domain-containing protein [Rhizobium sp. SG741]